MKILVVDSGGRGHVLAWSFLQDPRVEKVFCAPGNPGMSFRDKRIVPVREVKDYSAGVREEINGILGFVQREDIAFTIVGAEKYLTGGIVDSFNSDGFPVIGPTKKASVLEASKGYTKGLCQELEIPIADFSTFLYTNEAIDYVKKVGYPVVVKNDGLAAGKGSIVCSTTEEACSAIRTVFKNQEQGNWNGIGVVIERRLYGKELSFFYFTDGYALIPMGLAQDYKPAFDRNQGPNTGGMGGYSPHSLESKELARKVTEMVAQPLIDGFREKRGILYQGILYLGLMLVNGIPYVLEVNVRHGDPEAEVILPRMKTSLVDVCYALLNEELEELEVEWSGEYFCDVVLVSGQVRRTGSGKYPGYPRRYKIGMPIQGLEKIDPNCLVFSAGVGKNPEKGWVTTGGRVLNIVGRGETLAQAREMAYREAAKIRFEGKRCRGDIGLEPERSEK